MRRQIIMMFFSLILGTLAKGNDMAVVLPEWDTPPIYRPIEKPDTPTLLPVFPDEEGDKNKDEWVLEKNHTLTLEAKLNVKIPLEIISDIEINAIVLNDEEVDVPFDIELNKTPDKENYYKLKYSETEIDIDNDGTVDTFIYSPEYINKKIIKENYVKIKGKNISKDGEYKKKVYITIEVDE